MAGFDIDFSPIANSNPLGGLVQGIQYGQALQREKKRDRMAEQELAMRSQSADRDAEETARQRELDDEKQGFEFTKNAATALSQVLRSQGPEAFQAGFEKLKPMMMRIPGSSEEGLEQIRQAALQDPSVLDAIAGEADKHIRAVQENGHVIGFDERTGEEAYRVELPRDPVEDDYRRAQTEYMRAGVPLRGAQAEKARRPPAARGGGGGAAPAAGLAAVEAALRKRGLIP